jgi:hypothetical protein
LDKWQKLVINGKRHEKLDSIQVYLHKETLYVEKNKGSNPTIAMA